MCIGKMSLKRPWSKLQLIKELLICMFQIYWNSPLYWGNFSSFQASAITHPGSSQVLQAAKGGEWQMLVEREIQDAHCHCPSWSSAVPEVRALLGQSRSSPLAQCLPCPTGLCQVLGVIFGCCSPGCFPLPVCRTLGGCEGLTEFEDCFLRVTAISCNVKLLMFSKTQAERTC